MSMDEFVTEGARTCMRVCVSAGDARTRCAAAATLTSACTCTRVLSSSLPVDSYCCEKGCASYSTRDVLDVCAVSDARKSRRVWVSGCNVAVRTGG